MTNIEFKGGRLPFNAEKPKLMLAPYLKPEQLVVPAEADYLTGITKWPMYYNDTAGDCTQAGKYHLIQTYTYFGKQQEYVAPDEDALQDYINDTGYDPNTGANDTGEVMQDVLNEWLKGQDRAKEHKILAFAYIDPKDTNTIKAAIELFGGVYVGINFPDSAMQQFNSGQAWSVVPNAQIEGGHCIAVGKYDATSYSCVTWGAVQAITPNFWSTYTEEVWVALTEDWFNAQGVSGSKLDTDALGKDYTALTGKPSPFTPKPAPAPTPEPIDPTPTPEPTPNDESDLIFAGILDDWLASCPWFYKKVQKAAQDWLNSKALH